MTSDALGPALAPLSPLQATPQSLAAQARSGDKQSIERVAADFESMFLSIVLKEMRQTLEPGTLFGDDPSDSYGSLFDLYLGQHLARAGGLGIADMVKRYLGSGIRDQGSEVGVQDERRGGGIGQ